jgi:hypothetical protein
MYKESIRNYACIKNYAYICTMNKKHHIIHHFINIDYDIDKTVMLISETDDKNVLATYSVKMTMPKNYPQIFPYYSEILN